MQRLNMFYIKTKLYSRVANDLSTIIMNMYLMVCVTHRNRLDSWPSWFTGHRYG